jgi:hypothetical protein
MKYKFVNMFIEWATAAKASMKRTIVELMLFQIRQDFLLIKLAAMTVHVLRVMSV